MKDISVSDLLGLSTAERIQLVFDLWDSVAGMPEAVSLTEGQKEELEKRLEAFHKNPDAGSPWNLVKKRIISDS